MERELHRHHVRSVATSEGNASAGLMLHYDQTNRQFDPGARAAFLFRTREGTPGLLFVKAEAEDKRAKDSQESKSADGPNPESVLKIHGFSWTTMEELPEGKVK